MNQVWSVEQTEQGLQELLARLEQCRATGDENGVGYGKLALSHLVKWVRSDTCKPPFERANELAFEALEIFRRTGDKRGQVLALVSAASTSPSRPLLDEAEGLAVEFADESLQARVLAAQGRAFGLNDRAGAANLTRRALEIFRRLGDRPGEAQALFSLAIQCDGPEEQRDAGVEAARIYRELGNRGQAYKCVTLALFGAEKLVPLEQLEELVRQGLDDARLSSSNIAVPRFLKKLSLIATAKGQVDQALEYERERAWFLEQEGTPLERWTTQMETLHDAIGLAKSQGNSEAAKMF